MAASKEEILDAVSNMSVMDLVDLISAMEERFGSVRGSGGSAGSGRRRSRG